VAIAFARYRTGLFNKPSGGSTVAKPEWGRKRQCTSCGTKFYDLRRSPVICPSCGAEVDTEPLPRGRRRAPAPRPEATAPVAAAEAPEAEPEVEEEETAAESEKPESEKESEEDDYEGMIEDASELGEDDDFGDVVNGDEEDT